MKKAEIRVGGHYRAKVSGTITTVRVDTIRERAGYSGKNQTVYDVTNLKTGRKTTFRSAAKFRSERKSLDRIDRAEVEAVVQAEAKQHPDSEEDSCPFVAPTASTDATVTTPSSGSPKTVPATETTCPSCGAQVKVEDGRYTYHKHTTKGITCGVSGDKVREGEQGHPPTLAPARPAQSATATAAGTPAPAPSDNASMGLLGKLRAVPTPDAPPHVIVTARAGTGKTTTLIEGLKRMRGLTTSIVPSPQQQAVWDQLNLSRDAKTVCVVAFNRSIAQELKDRVPQGCEASTMHSMGLRAVTRTFGRLEVSEYVVPDLIAEILNTDLRQLRKESPVLLKATTDLVSLCKMNLVDREPMCSEVEHDAWIKQLDQLASHYDVDMNGSRSKVYPLVAQVLDRCRDPKRQGRIDYDDMIWLPVALDLPVFRFDLLLVDEAQDLNRCQQALAKKAGKRLVLVGDERQAIYGFAGADAESIPRMRRELEAEPAGCVVLPLTVTRRCGKAIVAEARQFVSDFEAHESNPDGSIREAQYPRYKDGQGVWCERPWEQTYGPAVREGDMVLCRTNAPLVSQCFRFMKRGIKANIQGRDVGQGLVATVRKSKAERVPDLLRWLENWHDSERTKEQAKNNPSEAQLTAIADRYACLLCFADGLTTTAEVIAKIESVFTDDKHKPGVKFSSVHKAKGLEARNVFILYPPEGGMRTDRMKPWELQQEDNIRYVAVTRAIEVLTYVG